MDIPDRLPMLLDGAIGTNLISSGYNKNECIEKWIIDNPEIVANLQREYVKKGAEIVYTPTLTANKILLERFGLEKDAEEINMKLAKITIDAVNGSCLVAGCMSAVYVKNAGVDSTEFLNVFYSYLEQAGALKKAGVDLFVIETMTSLSEARAAVLACIRMELPVFVTITTDDDGIMSDDSTAFASMVCLQEMGVSAFGLNCSDASDMADIFEKLSKYNKIPLIAKPSAGFFNENGEYCVISADCFTQKTTALMDKGVLILGGCCGTTPEYIAKLKEQIYKHKCSIMDNQSKFEEQFILANNNQVFFITPDNLETSEPITCDLDMVEKILELNETSIDVITIELFSYDDALLFYENSKMARLPIMLKSDSKIALETALLLYDGRPLVDSNCALEDDVLKSLAEKYGAVLY